MIYMAQLFCLRVTHLKLCKDFIYGGKSVYLRILNKRMNLADFISID